MDKKPDYSFMKSGFDLTGGGPSNNDQEQDIVAMVALFGENALRTSAIYTKHAERTVVTAQDIKRAMMMEVFIYTKRPDILEKLKTIKEELFPTNDDESSDEEESDEECGYCMCEHAFKESKCSCALCKCLNTIHERWVEWEPTAVVETILKKHIDAIDA
jgi:hypothetical protein